MVTLRELTASFGITGNASEALGSIDKASVGLLGKFKNMISGAADLSAAFGIVSNIARGLSDIFVSSIQEIGMLDDRADALNTNIEAMQAYLGVGNKIGISNKGLEKGLAKITAGLTAAGDKSSAQAKIFKDLGIATLDANGEVRSSVDVMNDLREAYQKDPTKAQPQLQKLLGEAYTENVGLLKLTTEEYEKLNATVKENGIITEEQQKAAEKVELSYGAMSKQLEVLKATLVQALGPAITFVIGRIQAMLKYFSKLIERIKGDQSWEEFARNLEINAILAYNAFVDYFWNPMVRAIWAFIDFFGQIPEFLKANEAEIIAILGGISAVLLGMAYVALPAIIAATKAWITATLIALRAYMVTIAQAAVANLAFFGPLLVIGGIIALVIYGIYKNWDNFVYFFNDVGQKIKDTWFSVTGAISEWWQKNVDQISSGIDFISSIFRNIFDLTPLGLLYNNWEMIVSFITGTLESISELWDSIWGPISRGMDKLKGFVGFKTPEAPQGRVPGSPPQVRLPGGQTDITNNTTDVGGIVINTQASDAKAVAKEVQKILVPNEKGGALASYRRTR